MRTKDQAQRVQKATYKPASLLSELEGYCTHIEYALKPFLRLEEQAKEAGVSVSDCFLRLIYGTSQSGGRTVNLQTRLLDEMQMGIPVLDPDGRTTFFGSLTRELTDTYRTGDQEGKRFYFTDVEAIRDRLADLGDQPVRIRGEHIYISQ